MTLLGMTFEQAAFSFGWGELVNFSGHLPTDSATYRAVNPNENKFSTGLQRNAILADICDAIRVFAFMFAKVHGGRAVRAWRLLSRRAWRQEGRRRSEDLMLIEFGRYGLRSAERFAYLPIVPP